MPKPTPARRTATPAAPRRHQALAFITDRIAATRICPSFDEIGRELGVSKSRAVQLVGQLAREGSIKRTIGTHRAIEVFSLTRPDDGSENLLEQLQRRRLPPASIPMMPPLSLLPDPEDQDYG